MLNLDKIVSSLKDKKNLSKDESFYISEKMFDGALSDTEIKEIDEQIEQEIQDGIIPDPSMMDPITGEPLPPDGGMMDAPPLDMGITNGQVDKDTKTAEI